MLSRYMKIEVDSYAASLWPLEGSTFEKNEDEEARLVQIIINESYQYSPDEIMKVYRLVPNHIELLHKCIEKGDKDAARELIWEILIWRWGARHLHQP